MISTANQDPEHNSAEGTTTDAFLGGRLEIVQRRAGHRAGSDAVFLAAALDVAAGQSVLDVGAGAGVAGLCVLARVAKAKMTAIEIDEVQCRLAAENAARNGFADRFEVIAANITAPAKTLREAGFRRESFDHVMANPPFYFDEEVRVAPDESRASAHVMTRDELTRWVRFLATAAAPRGTVTLIHRADQLGLLLALLQDRFGDLAVYPLFPKAGAPAGRVILQGRKNSRAKIRLLPGLALHDRNGTYTKMAQSVLREGAKLPFTSKGAFEAS